MAASLQDFSHVNLRTSRKVQVTALHKFIFEEEGDRNNRRRLREFQGFDYDETHSKYATKCGYVAKNLSQADLASICILLGLNYGERDQCAFIFKNLRQGHLLQDADGDDDYDEDEDDHEATSVEHDIDETVVEQQECVDDESIGTNDEDVYETQGGAEKPSTAMTHNRTRMTELYEPRFSFHFKDVEGLLEKFSGGENPSIQRWVSDFDEMALLYKWSELEKVTFARRLLDGSAKRFVNYEKCGKSWSLLKKKLIEEFGEVVDSKKVHCELNKRKIKPGESYQDYIYIMLEIAGQCNIEQRAVFQYIIEGIPDEPEKKSILYGAKTIRELKDKFVEYNSMKKERDNKSKAKGREEQSDQQSTKDQKKKSISKSGNLVKRCFNCGDQDHLSLNCPSKEKGVKCFKCNGYGHISTNCSKQKNSCVVSCANIQKCQTKVVIADTQFTALIDTGSDISLIREDEYEKLGAPKLKKRRLTFEGLGARKNCTIGELHTTILIDGVKVDVILHVVNRFILKSYSIILGTDVINKMNIRITKGVLTLFESDGDEQDTNLCPSIYKIDVCDNTTEPDLSYISNPNFRSTVASMIAQYKPEKTKDVGIEAKIILKSDVPIACRPRRLSPVEKDEVDRQIHQWQKEGIVRPSNSDYASAIVLVRKKNGSVRICIDYRGINQLIERPRFPLPLIDDQLDALQGAKVFSVVDLENGFFHVPVEQGSQKYTAFVTPTEQFEFLKMPFGLAIAPAVFQKFINAVFRDLINQKVVITYMDDLVILGNDEEEAVNHLQLTLQVAAQHGLKINWRKCQFLKNEIEYLGYKVSNGMLKPSENKVKAATNFPKPTNVKKVQSFLGLTGYFRKFIPQYSSFARPLTNLMKKDAAFVFGTREQEAFEALKTALTSEPVLQLFKVGAETELHTDACRFGYGMILMQKNDEDQKFHPVYFASGKTTAAEQNYTSYELEVLAVIKGLKKFRIYLLGTQFKIITDCQAFAMTMRKQDLSVRVARWVLQLEEFPGLKVCHRPGKNMQHVDALSRNPLPNVLLISENEDGLLMRLRRTQMNDEHLKKLSEEVMKNQKSSYDIKNGILYKNVNDDLLIVVPKEMQAQVVRRAHERGHFGINKTENIVKQDFWFEGLRKEVEKVVTSCLDCILAERKQGKQEGFLHAIQKGTVPLDTFHIDHLGPMTQTKKKYQYIFVVVDAFSKFVWLFPTKSTDAAAVIEALQKQSTVFGNPRRVISDRGAAFTSGVFREYCKAEHIEHTLIVTGVPRGNGQVERVNRTLIPLLTKLAAPNAENWYKFVNLAQKYLNSTINRSTGKTPFHLMFGTAMRIKEEVQVRELLEQEWETRFVEERDELRENAGKKIEKLQDEARKHFNKNRKLSKEYVKGDLVAIKRTQFGPGLKLHGKYLGPYEVVKALRNDRYVVKKKGNDEGPMNTSTTADFMKPWAVWVCDVVNEKKRTAFEGKCYTRMAECGITNNNDNTVLKCSNYDITECAVEANRGESRH